MFKKTSEVSSKYHFILSQLWGTQCCYLISMDLTLGSFLAAIWIFVTIKELSADQKKVVIEDIPTAPLALIKNINGDTFIPAIPKEYKRDKADNKLTFTYYYDDSKEVFLTVCPLPKNSLTKLIIQIDWRRKDYIMNDGSVLFPNSKHEIQTDCKELARPTIKKTQDICNTSKDVFYEAGYSVSNDMKKEKVQFIPIYKICYSTVHGTLYSLHRIEAPNLLLLDIPEFYTIRLSKALPSKLDGILEKKLGKYKSRKDHFLYNLVEQYNMPTKFYNRACLFLFNLTPIPYSRPLLRGMATFENFVRLFGRATGKHLTIYSGIYTSKEKTTTEHCTATKNCDMQEPVMVKSLWRIIKDSEDNGVIFITQYTSQVKCDTSKLLCIENFSMLRNYTDGGCTYLCPTVDKKMIEDLGLPSTVTISGNLDLTFPKTAENSKEQETSSTKEYVNISTFIPDRNFPVSLHFTDAVLSETIEKGLPADNGDDECSDDGGGTTGCWGGLGKTGGSTGGGYDYGGGATGAFD